MTQTSAPPADINRSVRRLHRLSAAIIIAFLALHLANHATMLWGADRHIAVMDTLRPVYRQPLVELFILGAFAFQLISGAMMLWRGRGGASTLAAKVQRLSGFGLVLFIANHVAAVQFGRLSLGLDTNYYFAAAGFQLDGWRLFFMPYYFLGVALIGVHLAAALWWNSAGAVRRFGPMIIAAAFALFAGALVFHMMQPATIPDAYLATYR